MTPADLAFFVAEHDDHHLARIGELVDGVAGGGSGTEQLFFVLERFRPGCAAEVYRRFRDRGRLAPDGLRYVSSWVSVDLAICYQIMECDERRLLDEWIGRWQDLVDFEVISVVTSAEAQALVAPRL